MPKPGGQKELGVLEQKNRTIEAQRGDMVWYRLERYPGARCQGLAGLKGVWLLF